MFSFYILGFFQLKMAWSHLPSVPRSQPRPSPTAKSLASNSLTLDALMFVVLPGNPDSDTYNDHLPDEFTSMAYAAPAMHYAPPIFPILPWATSAFLPPFIPQQNSNSYPTAAYKGEFVLSSIDTRNAPPTLIPNPRNVAASTSSMFTSLAQEDSALNRSAANPYSYPMTQM
ncbi:hypothetical protein B0H14DRAFT_2570598 [Mycena olivaceomarginata]|nr:hypothetical protein B0H14DRAFT_2570598 [Mycena olivaceomarginata]